MIKYRRWRGCVPYSTLIESCLHGPALGEVVALTAGRVNLRRRRIEVVGHASAAMTLDIYAGLFADDLDTVADQLDRAFARTNTNQIRTNRRPDRRNQAALPFEKPPEQVAG